MANIDETPDAVLTQYQTSALAPFDDTGCSQPSPWETRAFFQQEKRHHRCGNFQWLASYDGCRMHWQV
jgi:hypothetical protein